MHSSSQPVRSTRIRVIPQRFRDREIIFNQPSQVNRSQRCENAGQDNVHQEVALVDCEGDGDAARGNATIGNATAGNEVAGIEMGGVLTEDIELAGVMEAGNEDSEEVISERLIVNDAKDNVIGSEVY